MKKKIEFPRGVYTVRIPFLLSPGTPWQDQVVEQLNKTKETYDINPRHSVGFLITQNIAEITINKN